MLEEPGLVVTRRSGREKLHFLNPVPIQLIHDRWIRKYIAGPAAALADAVIHDRVESGRRDSRRACAVTQEQGQPSAIVLGPATAR